MSDPHDPNQTVDESSVAADSLDAGLAAAFGRPAQAPRSSLDASQRPVLLREAKGESAHVVKPHSDAMPSKGESGDRYQLFGEIARGGMGAVLRGRDVDLGRDLAVKVLLEKHADNPAVARRFLEEAQIGGQLQHPGVVPVYDVGRFGDRPFFTMKLVKGHTLAALLSERGEPSQDRPRFLGIALQVAQALAYAHAKGVIHRDLKPANIMVGAFGEVQVMDWGLAKVLAEGGVADEERAGRQHQPTDGTQIRTARSSGTAGSGGTDTEAGSLLGTPAYMPPEQANGEVALLDRRCDVFELGAILCEVLTGQPPYVGRSAEEVRRKAANGDLADARARLDGCGADPELIGLIRGCLSPEAIDRPKDAQEVADALTAYLEGVQERLRQAELAEAAARARAVEEARRRRTQLGLVGALALLLTVGAGGGLYLQRQHELRQLERAQRESEMSTAVRTTLDKVDELHKAGALERGGQPPEADTHPAGQCRPRGPARPPGAGPRRPRAGRPPGLHPAGEIDPGRWQVRRCRGGQGLCGGVCPKQTGQRGGRRSDGGPADARLGGEGAAAGCPGRLGLLAQGGQEAASLADGGGAGGRPASLAGPAARSRRVGGQQKAGGPGGRGQEAGAVASGGLGPGLAAGANAGNPIVA
jgi:hypothetical protein